MIYDEDPLRRRPGKSTGLVKTTGGVCLNGGTSGQMAFRTQENRKIRSSDGCGENSVLSTMVRGYDLHKLGGYLGNIGFTLVSRELFGKSWQGTKVIVMEWSKIILEFVADIAWPIVILALIWLFRKPVEDLIGRLRRVQHRDIEFEFSDAVKSLRVEAEEHEIPGKIGEPVQVVREDDREFLALAKEYPSAAIIESWKEVELALLEISVKESLKGYQPPVKIANHLYKTDALDKHQFHLFNELRMLRNEAVHEEEARRLPAGSIIEYRDLTRALARAIREIGSVKL